MEIILTTLWLGTLVWALWEFRENAKLEEKVLKLDTENRKYLELIYADDR
jgi:hypothetical protein